MGRSAGAGSPVWFRCWACRSTLVNNICSTVTLTGRTKPCPHRKHHALGVRSTDTLREYGCPCGHVGWSNHIDLARMAGEGRWKEEAMTGQEWGENMKPLAQPGDAAFEIGEKVTLAEDDSTYPGEQATIRKRGMGTGMYHGDVVYDVSIEGTDSASDDPEMWHRVWESGIAEAE